MAFKNMMRTVNNMFNRTNASNIAKFSRLRSVGTGLSKADKLAHASIRNRTFATGFKNNKLNWAQHKLNQGMDLLGGGISQGTKRLARATLSSPTSMAAQFAVGASAMAGISMMQGGLHKMNQVMTERYMRDSRYSSQVLAQTNIGQARGNSALNLGNTAGLSLSMHRGRHG